MYPYGNVKYFFEGDTLTFSERLVQLQQERGLDKKDIYNACNISRISYYRYESEKIRTFSGTDKYYETATKEPTMSKLAALADYFDVSLDYLVGRTDNPEINRWPHSRLHPPCPWQGFSLHT